MVPCTPRPRGAVDRGGDGVFSSLGWPEMAVLLVVAMFVFGPDRLPGAAADAGRALRRARQLARSLRDDLAEDMPELRTVDVRSLHPRTFLVRHVLDDEPHVRPRTTRPAARPHDVRDDGPRRPPTGTAKRTPQRTPTHVDPGGDNGELGND